MKAAEDRGENGQFRRQKMILECRWLVGLIAELRRLAAMPMPGEGEAEARRELSEARSAAMRALFAAQERVAEALQGKDRRAEVARLEGFEAWAIARLKPAAGDANAYAYAQDCHANYVDFCKAEGVFVESQRVLTTWLLRQDIVTGYRALARGRALFGFQLLPGLSPADLDRDFPDAKAPSAGLEGARGGQEGGEEPSGGDTP